MSCLVCLCAVIEAKNKWKKTDGELARILLLHLLVKGTFLWRSFPYIAINETARKFFKIRIIKNNCLLQQPSSFLTDEYYNPRKLRLTKIKINEIFSAKVFHNMKKLYRTLFLGEGGGGQFSWRVYFRGHFSRGHFSGGIFPRGIFPSTK